MSENKKAVPGRDGKRATTDSTLNIAQNNITMFHLQCQQPLPILQCFFNFANSVSKNIPQLSSQGICQTMLYAAKYFLSVKENSKIPPPVTEGVFFYHTFSETPIASYKRCFCFVLAPGTALSIASFFLRLAELVIVLPFSSLSPVMPRVAK